MIPDPPYAIEKLTEHQRNEVRSMVTRQRMGRNVQQVLDQHAAQTDAERICTSGAKALLSRLQAQWSSAMKRYRFHPDH